jgi:hypothetical protein
MIRSLTGAIALIALSFAPAMAQDTGSTAPTAQPVSTTSTTVSSQVVCHHDGEIIQAPSGPVICHQKHPSGVHNMSRQWFQEQQMRSSTMNH